MSFESQECVKLFSNHSVIRSRPASHTGLAHPHPVQSRHAAQSPVPAGHPVPRGPCHRSRQPDHPRQGLADPPRPGLRARARAPAHRRPAWRRQDYARAGPRKDARPGFPPHPVHKRHAACRYHRGVRVRTRKRGIQVPSGAGVRPGDPRRRDQPGHAQDAERTARGNGGAPGHRRRGNAPPARAVLCHCHPESDRTGRHVSAAGIPA